nr:hypothetical protein [Tanacetum cinerariifolium]
MPNNDDVNMKFLRALPPSWSLEIDVKGGLSYSLRGTTVAPTHSTFIGAASTNTKMVYSDQPSHSSLITYTSDHSGSIMKDVLHLFVAKNEPTQKLAYEDFKQVDQMEKEELDIKWQMAMLSLRINRFQKKAGRKINFNNKDLARFDTRKARCYNCLQLGHFTKECNVKKVDKKASLVAGFKSDLADHAGNAAGSVYDAAVEFAMMGISSKEVKLKESLARTKLGLGFKESIGSDEVFDLSTPSVFDPKPETREVKSLYERFVKAGEMHEVPPSITGTFMPTSYKSDLEETQVTFGSKSNTSESNDFVFCDNSDKSSESETYDFASCVSNPKTNDSFSTVDVKILPKSDVKDPSPTNGFPSCSFKENVKPLRNLYNFPSVVSKAASVPTAFIFAGRSIPAASRNRPASIHAGRHILAGFNRPAPFLAGRFIPTGWTNHAARPFFRPTNLYFNNVYWPGIYNHISMNEGRWGYAVKSSTYENVADLLTKAFDGLRFHYLIVHIGMLNP